MLHTYIHRHTDSDIQIQTHITDNHTRTHTCARTHTQTHREDHLWITFLDKSKIGYLSTTTTTTT